MEEIWENGILAVVHAQSPRRIERCAELGRGPSGGESACPRSDPFKSSAVHTQQRKRGETRLELHKRASRIADSGTFHRHCQKISTAPETRRRIRTAGRTVRLTRPPTQRHDGKHHYA